MEAQGGTQEREPRNAAPTLTPELGGSRDSVRVPHDFVGVD